MSKLTREPNDINIELALLSFMANKQNYLDYNTVLKSNRLLEETNLLLKDYGKYFALYDHPSIDFGTFYVHFAQDWHAEDLSDLDIEYYKEHVFPKITKVPQQDVENCLLALYNAETLSSIKNSANLGHIKKLLDTYETKLESLNINNKDDDLFTINDLNFDILDTSKGIPWFLPTLQTKLGGIIPEQFILVCADNNTGKGAFCVSQVKHTLEYFKNNDIKKPILYFNSESSVETVFMRLFSCMYKDRFPSGKEEILRKKDEVLELFKQQYGEEAVYVMQIRHHNIQWIESKIKKYNPGLVIIDLLDALSPDLGWESLTKLYNKVRIIADEHYPIIATSQTGNTKYYDAETGQYKSRKFLTDKDTAGSKFGKGGAASMMLMIGVDDDVKQVRYITLTKDKEGVGELNLTCKLEEKYSLYQELAW